MHNTEMTARPRVFLAEDHYTIALALTEVLADLGYVVVGEASSAEAAVTMAADIEADVAILDINMGDGWSYGAAQRLLGRGIPVVFTSGYDVPPELPADLLDVPLLLKPVTDIDIKRALRAVAPVRRKR